MVKPTKSQTGHHANIKEKNKVKIRRTPYDIIKDHQLIFVFATLLLSIYSIYYTQKYTPEYAIINKDGTIAYQKGFGKYGLFVEIKEKKEDYGMRPIYLLSFKNEPDYFEVTSRKAVLSEVTKIGSNKYMVTLFQTGGYGGNIIIASDFKIQAY